MGMRGIMVEMWGIRVGMMRIKVGIQGTVGGNEENTGENLRIGVELTNYNCGEGQK